MIEKIERFLFLSLLFFLPTQVGKHFWPDFSKVSGIRLDYLSPTLYLTDIVVFLLFFVVVVGLVPLSKTFFKQLLQHSNKNLLLLLAISIGLFVYHSLFSLSPMASLYASIKVLEMVFVGIYVAYRIHAYSFVLILRTLLVSSVLVSLLAGMQLLSQRTIGGVWYFLGERTFSVSTPQIATFLYNGQELLRPYATFSHPNVLAFFLFMTLVLTIVFFIGRQMSFVMRIILVFISLILFLTFSRIVISMYSIFLCYVLFKNTKHIKRLLLPLSSIMIAGVGYILLFKDRFLTFDLWHHDFMVRYDLIIIALSVWMENPLLGVGLNNFYIHEITYQKELSEIFLQPVHTIYIFVLSQLGLIGFIVFCIFIALSIGSILQKVKQADNSFYIGILIVCIAFLIQGFFDHFFLTVQQGQLMTALIFGLCWSKRIARQKNIDE